ncbi:metal ABC transporter substrate-binding protein [Oceanobacillus caeni]|uniref:metal ABC transporter substrate-binding protein n=1 Tax=Oceanobacillus TaxID=182709 RepID=UPI000621A30B|nr:metal ABC transporter substrate-binding protein [Oceanobacillus caeni]KKE79591.1 zinc ABC transporter substrate-binding protein [Bacilli bacterium VT-13-104]PZD89698.1 metal ABC transporter substrate-binding protein [Bacilli bacterium]MBU8790227.1 metal ABC transporter substrate-binding protein [Oceanobacillus caeni]MCR1833442.1 metal ABC transporter substrate-binding protein [Oceanobacillus caeni]PZD91220.1 metal ABC transporter substrate-binding protein [Bacilli bacterium]
MRRLVRLMLSLAAISLLLAACGNKDVTANDNNDDVLKVVTSFTLLEDIVHQIGGEHVEIHNLVPIGTDPHEYEPLPEDIKKATDADILFYNGLNLEGGEHGWFFKMMNTVGQKDENIFELTKGVEPKYLNGKGEAEHEMNPHAFLDPNVGMIIVENAHDALVKADPENKEEYDKNAKAYIEKLKEIDEEYKNKIADIPEENRILVTSERAFQYMADRYGLEEGYIWEIDTEENGSPEQIKSLVNFLKERDVPTLFLESNVDSRPMETVSEESGVEIYKDKIFSDEIGKKGEAGDTYIKFLEYNIDKIYNGLKGD